MFPAVAIHYRKCKEFRKALDVTEILLHHMEGVNRLRPSIEKIKCLVALEKASAAKDVWFAVTIHLIKSSDFDKTIKECYPNIDKDLTELLNALKSCPRYDDVINTLSDALIRITKKYFSLDPGRKLKKLSKLGSSLKDWTPRSKKLTSKKMNVLNKLLEEMQKVDGVDVKDKSILIATFLCDLGEIYQKMDKHVRCGIAYLQAITLIRTTCGREAEKWKILGECYHKLGIAHQKSFDVDKSNNALLKAGKIYQNAVDSTQTEKQEVLQQISMDISNLSDGKYRTKVYIRRFFSPVYAFALFFLAISLLIVGLFFKIGKKPNEFQF